MTTFNFMSCILTRMNSHMVLKVGCTRKSSVTIGLLADIRSFPCVGTDVNFSNIRRCEALLTPFKRALKWSFTCKRMFFMWKELQKCKPFLRHLKILHTTYTVCNCTSQTSKDRNFGLKVNRKKNKKNNKASSLRFCSQHSIPV